MTTETRRTSVWCDKCSASVFHGAHPEFAVRGEVKAETEFNVDLLALIKAWPDDWDRIRESQQWFEEAINELIVGVLIEGEEWGPSWEPKGFIRCWSDEPELDWNAPRGSSLLDDLEAVLRAEGLWGDPAESAADSRMPGPGQIALGDPEVPS